MLSYVTFIQEGFVRAGSCILQNPELGAFTVLDRDLTESLWSSFMKWEIGTAFAQISASTHVQHRVFYCLGWVGMNFTQTCDWEVEVSKVGFSTEVLLGESWKPDSVAFLFAPFFIRKEKSGWQCVLNIGCQAGWRVQTSPIQRKQHLTATNPSVKTMGCI